MSFPGGPAHAIHCFFDGGLWRAAFSANGGPDLTAPEVKHQPNSDPLSAGVTFRMNATVTDNVGVDSVSLFYRRVGESQYLRKAMLRETQDSDDFSVTLGSKDLAAPGIELHSSH